MANDNSKLVSLTLVFTSVAAFVASLTISAKNARIKELERQLATAQQPHTNTRGSYGY